MIDIQRSNYVITMRTFFSITLLSVLYCAFMPVPVTATVADVSPVLHGAAGTVAAQINAVSHYRWPTDQISHFAAFAVLAVQSAMAFPRTKTRFLALGLLAVGVGIEIVQAIPALGRTPQWSDILGDIAGISFGFAAVYAVWVLSSAGPKLKARKLVHVKKTRQIRNR